MVGGGEWGEVVSHVSLVDMTFLLAWNPWQFECLGTIPNSNKRASVYPLMDLKLEQVYE